MVANHRSQNRVPTGVIITTLSVLMLLLFAVDLSIGSVGIPLRDVIAALTGQQSDEVTSSIVLDIRLIKALVAILAGAALSVSGLQMQTLFRNPLAGPYVLGISAGASLGVALIVLAGVGFGTFGQFGIAGAAWVGSAVVLAVIGIVGNRVRDIMTLLILGILFSSGVGAIVQILQYISKEEDLKAYVVWTMGSLGDVTWMQFMILLPSVLVGLILAFASVKSLNLYLFGEEYARSMGLDIKSSRRLLFASTTLLAGTTTAFCGPVGFIGMAMPHVARFIIRNSDHRILLPATLLVGADVMILCDLLSKIYAIPINAVTSLAGIPIVIWIVLKIKQ